MKAPQATPNEFRPANSLPWREGLLVAVVGWVAFVCLALYLGPDLNVDSLHYHFYLAKNAWGHAITRDFLAAGLQSYLTPYAYVPLAWMQEDGWTNVTALIFIATLQSAMVPSLWLCACAIFGVSRGCDAVMWRVLAVVAALSCPVLLTQVGSTFIDLGTSIPVVLAGALCGLASNARRPVALLLFAGALLGLATALKWTQGPLAVSMVIAGAFASRISDKSGFPSAPIVKAWLIRAAIISVAFGVVFCLIMANWSMMLWKEFGNPIFPMANAWFKSPDFGNYSFVHNRFVPDEWAVWLAKPLLMLDIYAYVHTETRAPDARPFLFCALLVILAAYRLSAPKPRSAAAAGGGGMPAPRYTWLLVFVTVGWCVWLAWSGNGRYAIALFAVLGLALVAVMARVRAFMPAKLFRLVVLVVVCSQALLMSSAAYRWSYTKSWNFSDRFVRGELPPKLQEEPATFVTINGLTHSHLAATGHRASRWLGILGSASINPQGPGFERARKILSQSGRIYLLLRGGGSTDRMHTPANFSPVNKAQLIAETIRPYGLEAIALQPCVFGGTHSMPSEKEWDNTRSGFWYCPLRYSAKIVEQSVVERQSSQDRKIEQAMDAAETLCPRLLRPAKAIASIRGPELRYRIYPPTDATLIYEAGRLRIRAYADIHDAELGSVDEVMEAKVGAPEMCYRSVNPGRPPWDR